MKTTVYIFNFLWKRWSANLSSLLLFFLGENSVEIEEVIVYIAVGDVITSTLAPLTVQTTTTTTLTTTTTVVPPDVSTTESFSTTSIITDYTTLFPATVTTTSTDTVVVSSTTSMYAACASTNLAVSPLSAEYGILAGEYVQYIGWGELPLYSSTSLGTDTAYDCCVLCLTDPNCAFGAWAEPSGLYSGLCWVIDTEICDQPFNAGTGTAYMTTHGGEEYDSQDMTVFNGNCGTITGTQSSQY